jgi:hypothetical protein
MTVFRPESGIRYVHLKGSKEVVGLLLLVDAVVVSGDQKQRGHPLSMR